jgi:hypothetical protein
VEADVDLIKFSPDDWVIVRMPNTPAKTNTFGNNDRFVALLHVKTTPVDDKGVKVIELIPLD